LICVKAKELQEGAVCFSAAKAGKAAGLVHNRGPEAQFETEHLEEITQTIGERHGRKDG
jgi:hypothetical protein